MGMTYQEGVDDAMSDINALTTYTAITQSQKQRSISMAIHELQKLTNAVRYHVTVNAADLDADGSIALSDLEKDITVPERVWYLPQGSTSLASATGGRKVIKVEPSVLDSLRMSSVSDIYMCVDRSRLYFYPFAGLTGTFDIVAIAKLPVYTESRAAKSTGDWAGWDAANLVQKMEDTEIPEEFADAEEEIVAFTAAKLIELIPGWENHFKAKHAEFMFKFEQGAPAVQKNLPTYPTNYTPKPNYGY